MESEQHSRLHALERSVRWLRIGLLASLGGLALLAVAVVAVGPLRTDRWDSPGDSLRVRELVIVDSSDSVRVRIGAHLPDATIDGRALNRGEDASGILLYDDTGRERSGYVTFAPSRNVALTLDTRDRQVALFSAGPEDGVAARLWREEDWVEMRADAKGTRLSVGRDGQLVLQEPPMTVEEADAGCAELKEELAQIEVAPPVDQVMQACMRHMTDSACRRCLGVS